VSEVELRMLSPWMCPTPQRRPLCSINSFEALSATTMIHGAAQQTRVTDKQLGNAGTFFELCQSHHVLVSKTKKDET